MDMVVPKRHFMEYNNFHVEIRIKKIVLALATSKTMALLLPNGRTSDSRFHIYFDISEESTCEIRQISQLVELL